MFLSTTVLTGEVDGKHASRWMCFWTYGCSFMCCCFIKQLMGVCFLGWEVWWIGVNEGLCQELHVEEEEEEERNKKI